MNERLKKDFPPKMAVSFNSDEDFRKAWKEIPRIKPKMVLSRRTIILDEEDLLRINEKGIPLLKALRTGVQGPLEKLDVNDLIIRFHM